MAESESKTGIVKFEDVLDRELIAITTRRKRAGLVDSVVTSATTTPATSDAQTSAASDADSNTARDRAASKNLIGLALSGGGVRSASFCLGVLQGLHRRGVLPLVDYLSTVSGGGYAGAYLSSSALSPEPPNPASTKTAAHSTEKSRPANRLDVVLGTGPEQPQRVRELIGNGSFLLRNRLAWVNRTCFGMLLIWAFVGSGLFALTSLAALLYRSLDAMPCRHFLWVLGIADQLSLDLFPPFVMFLIYVLIWSISYFRSGRAAQGWMARWWFVATVVVTLVAMAKLMGSGNITVDAVAGLIGQEPIDWIGGLFNNSSFPALIYGAIAASLLPYLRPDLLFRSGGEGQSGVQRAIFTVASWALLAGVPFLLVAYFAHEGIGGGHQLADDRLRVPQVKEWRNETTAPLWLAMQRDYEVYNSSLKKKPAQQDASPSATKESSKATQESSKHLWLWVNDGRLKPLKSAGEPTHDPGIAQAEMVGETPKSDDEPTLLFHELETLYAGLTKYEMRKSLPVEKVIPDAAWSWRTTRLSILTRWYHLIEYSLGCALGVDATDEYQFAMILKQHQEIQELKERIVFRLNQLLLRPDFHEFLPESVGDKDERFKAFQEAHGAAVTMANAMKSEGLLPAGKLKVGAINGGDRDTPWLLELRPRWAMLRDNVQEEFSLNRLGLSKQRIREEQSFYPDDAYPRYGVESPADRNGKAAVQDQYEQSLPRALPPAVIQRMAALQSDSFYVPKQWDQVRSREALGGFTEDPTDARARSSAEAEAAGKQAKKRMKWLPLLPQAWHELPWQSGMPTTLRDIDRNLQVELATDAGNMRRMLAANRKLLEVYLPGMITPRTEKYSYMVLYGDQAVRWSWFCWSLGFFLVLGLILDLNATSWHGFYADQIAGAWIQAASGLDRQIPLGQLRTTDEGLPYHLISGSLNPFRRPIGSAGPQELFLLSQQFAGSESMGYRAISDLRDDNYNLASAVAISGGAVNPLNATNPLQQALLLLGNVRLGQWLQNPGYKGGNESLLEKVRDKWPITPFRFLAALTRPLDRWKYCFVTDGGLTENLGITQLLLRRCKLILAIDAGQDEKFQFHDLSKLLRWMQVEQGIRVTWPSVTTEVGERAKKSGLGLRALSPLVCTTTEDKAAGGRDKAAGRRLNPDATQHHLLARIEYPGYATATPADREKYVGYLVYMKSTICETDPVDLVSYQQAHPQFPHDPTSDFAFDRDQFESYRRLGQQTMESALDAVPDFASAPSGTAFIAAVRRASGLSCEAEPVGVGDSNTGEGSSTPTTSAAEQVPEVAAAGNAAPEVPASPSNAPPVDPDLLLKTALEHGNLMNRKEAVLKLKNYPKQQQELIVNLVKQLDDANDTELKEVHSLLLDLHDKALRLLCERFEGQEEVCQIRSVRVIGYILLDHIDLPTVRLLVDWQEKPFPTRVLREIRDAIRRIPLDGYQAEEELKIRVSLALSH